jgi:hypothetical protein
MGGVMQLGAKIETLTGKIFLATANYTTNKGELLEKCCNWVILLILLWVKTFLKALSFHPRNSGFT